MRDCREKVFWPQAESTEGSVYEQPNVLVLSSQKADSNWQIVSQPTGGVEWRNGGFRWVNPFHMVTEWGVNISLWVN